VDVLPAFPLAFGLVPVPGPSFKVWNKASTPLAQWVQENYGVPFAILKARGQVPDVTQVLAGIRLLGFHKSLGFRRPFDVVQLHLVFISIAAFD
jgi:hypothetical protein